MRKITFLAALLSIFFCLGTEAQTTDSISQDKVIIGYVNRQEVKNVIPEAVQFETEYAKIKEEYEQQFNLLTEQYDEKVMNYLKRKDSFTEALRLALQTEITELESRINLYKKRYQADLSKRRSDFYGPLDEKIDEAISQVSAERKITIVFDKDTPVYVSPSCVDITPFVKIKLGL